MRPMNGKGQTPPDLMLPYGRWGSRRVSAGIVSDTRSHAHDRLVGKAKFRKRVGMGGDTKAKEGSRSMWRVISVVDMA